MSLKLSLTSTQKFSRQLFILGVAASTLWVSPLLADTAFDLRKQVADRYEGEDSSSETLMRLQKIKRAKDGTLEVSAERVRKTKRMSKAYGKDDKSVIFFMEPADVRNTAFLSFVYDDEDRDNDQWLYLPALKKTRRIASGDKSGSFMGSDFSYVDVSGIKVEKYNHKLLGDAELGSLVKDKALKKVLKQKFGSSKEGFQKAKAWFAADGLQVVESIPKEKKTIKEDGYSRIIAWINAETSVVEKAIYFGKNGKAFKVRDNVTTEKIQDVWSMTRMEMENFAKGHRTIIDISDTRYNVGVKDSYFTQRTLTQGL